MHFTNIVSGLAVVAGLASAHPGDDPAVVAAEQAHRMTKLAVRADLSHCAETLRARGVERRNIARRQATVNRLRAERGLLQRDIDDVLAEDHESAIDYTPETDPDVLFSGNASCILTPETTQGPYYVSGEYIRSDVTEGQEGVLATIDYQVIDYTTCEPVPELYLEIWACNSTGVYGGVLASGNGNTDDESNLDNTAFRGIQPTDEDGVAVFQTIVPGHYTGRTPHIHIMTHVDATVYPNGTLGNEAVSSHIGQAFFDQSLYDEVMTISPYSTNTQELTTNEQDSIMAQEAATGHDPVHEYSLLGETLEDGLFMWLAFGIDTSRAEEIEPAVFLYEEGGVVNENGGGGGPPPNGSFPGTK